MKDPYEGAINDARVIIIPLVVDNEGCQEIVRKALVDLTGRVAYEAVKATIKATPIDP